MLETNVWETRLIICLFDLFLIFQTEMQAYRKKVRYEISQLEKLLLESRRELELLRVEYEHNMKAHEQIGPMAKEMRHLINSLQV